MANQEFSFDVTAPRNYAVASAFSNLDCSVEIYPFEGGPRYFRGSQVRAVTVRKSIRGDAAGTFHIELVPGGPLGVEDDVTWSQVVTPMSHVLIGMARGADAAIVMDGIATSTGEVQEWATTDRGSAAG